jgi:hypothetical protein
MNSAGKALIKPLVGCAVHTITLLLLACDGDQATIQRHGLAAIANAQPILFVVTFFHPPVEAGICPCMRTSHEQMFYRIVVDIVDVMNHVFFIADAVLPEPLLPNPALAMLAARGGDSCFVAMVSNPLLSEPPLGARPAGGEIAVIFGQGPYSMDTTRQQHNCDCVERLLGLYRANSGPQVLASHIIRKEVAPICSDNGEEERTSRLELSPVIGHQTPKWCARHTLHFC